MPDKRLFVVVLLLTFLTLPLLAVRPASFAAVSRGDGHADLAVGVPGEDIGTLDGAGAVNVLYAMRGGISSLNNKIWDQDDFWGDSEAETFDGFGRALAAGDFDADAYDDLAVGVPGEDVAIPGYVSNAGIVQVLYGSPPGLSTAGLQTWCQGGCSGMRDTAEENDQFGLALTAGDFNADAYDDLAVGVPWEDVGADADAGAVSVIYGSSRGLSLLAAVSDQVWHQDSPDIEGGTEPYDTFGSALAAGDFDGDGYDDLAVGVPGEDVGTINSAGAVNILYGSPAGLAAADNKVWTQDDFSENGAGELDLFGFALAAGDLNGDGRDDLAIGVRNEDVGTASAAGAVNVLYGSAAGLSSAGSQFWDQGSNLADDPETNDFFGASLAIGDLNGDGYDDLVVGVPREDVGTTTDAGALNVILGTSSGLHATGNMLWNEDYFTAGLAAAGDQFGFALAVADMDADGYDDLAVGVPYKQVSGRVEAGVLDILYGADYWPGGWASGYSQDAGGVEGQAEIQDHFGSALAAGDFRGRRIYLPIVVRN